MTRIFALLLLSTLTAGAFAAATTAPAPRRPRLASR